MTRNLKALGLALVAAFAFSAMVANAAQAQNGRITSTGPVTLKSVELTGSPEASFNSLTSAAGTITCPKTVYTGHKTLTIAETEAKKTHELIPVNSESVTITPHYGACTALGFPATVDMNGCDYTFDLKTTKETSVYNITATVHCPTGKHIQITIFTGASHAIRACTITITEKTDYDGLHVRDTGNNFLDVTGTIEGIESHQSTEFGCTNPGSTDKTGILHIDVKVEGLNNKGETTALSLSHL